MATAGQQSVHMMLELLPPHIVRLDDWKGVTEQADRRRVQNRINQRAARKRKRASARNDLPNSAQRGPKPSRNQLTSIITTGPKVDASSALFKIQDPSLWQLFHSAMESVPADRSKLINFAQNIALHSADMQRALRSFEKWMYFLTGSPKRDCLFTLIQFNVFRAMVTNERHVGLPEACALDDDAVSPISDRILRAQEMPTPLQPTLLQRKITHHPWIDLLPSPRMRDNLLRAEDEYDETGLCTEILGCSPNSDGRTGMIVWGEAWDPAGWEFTEDFMSRWGWTLYGCDDSLTSTNYWRQRRGKRPLKFE